MLHAMVHTLGISHFSPNNMKKIRGNPIESKYSIKFDFPVFYHVKIY